MRAVVNRTLTLAAAENGDLSAYSCAGRRAGNARSCRISDVSASTMWPSPGRVLPRGRPRPSDLQRAPAYPVTPDRPKVNLEVMDIDDMTLCEREARGERAQSRRSASMLA
jgi:hypothetical protein